MVGDIHVCVYVSLTVTIKFVLKFSFYIYRNFFVYLFLYRIYKKNYIIISRDVERTFGHIQHPCQAGPVPSPSRAFLLP